MSPGAVDPEGLGEGGGMRLWKLLTLGMVASTSACVRPPAGTVEESRKARAHAAALNARVANLEDRLLANQANVHLWEELGRRREKVAEVACQNQDSHLQGMVEHIRRQEEKGRQRRQRLAQRAEPMATRARAVKHSP